MAKEIIMPKFGFNQEESEILEWLKENGDKVDKGDPIAVVSTDKISMEVEAPEGGTLDGIQYKVGDIVPVTKIIAYILQPGEKVPDAPAEDAAVKTATSPEKSEAAPQKADVVEKAAGVSISPVAQRLAADEGVDISLVSGSGKGGQITKKDVETYLASQSTAAGKVKATPAARRIAKDKGINLAGIAGSGPGGRIQAADVSVAKPSAAPTEVPFSTVGVAREIPLIGMRRAIATNMQRSMQEAPHMVLQMDVEMDAAEGLRKLANNNRCDDAPKVSVTAVIVKAVASALKQNPIVNSQFAGDRINVMADINVGVAAALDDGLIVPVIHNVDNKDLQQISAEVIDLAKRARESRLQPQDLADGTFTISNLGMYGIDRFSAIINPPQAAILAVGKMNQVFIADDQGQPVLRKVITFSLSADHRVMDGTQAAKFLSDLNKNLNNLGEIIK